MPMKVRETLLPGALVSPSIAHKASITPPCSSTARVVACFWCTKLVVVSKSSLQSAASHDHPSQVFHLWQGTLQQNSAASMNPNMSCAL